MQLYGFQINEQSVSMQRKAYYCKLIADTDQLARQIKYYGAEFTAIAADHF